MRNHTKLWLLAVAAVAPLVCQPGQAAAATGDGPDQVNHYGETGLTGFASRPIAVLGDSVKDLGQLDLDITAMMGFSCTRANNCYGVTDENGNQLTIPTGLESAADKAKRWEAAAAIVAAKQLAGSAKVFLIDAPSQSGTHLVNQFNALASANVAAKFAVPLYGLASNDAAQATIHTFLTNHTGILAVAPAGFLTSAKVVQVGGSTYTSGNPDTTWSGFTGANDIMSRADAIPQVRDGSATTQPSMGWAAAFIAARLSNESTAIPTRLQLLGADSSHFAPVSGSNSALGVFVDGSDLIP